MFPALGNGESGNAAVNVGVQISLREIALSSSMYIPRNGIAGSYGNSMFNILKNCHPVLFLLFFPGKRAEAPSTLPTSREAP